MNREQWLSELAEAMRPYFGEHELTIPEGLRISCGFPGGRGNRSNTIGQCWVPEVSSDGTTEVFVSPVLDDSMRVADVLAHELVHAAGYHGHRKNFAKAAKSIGLEGNPTATVAGEDFIDWAKPLVDSLPPYPHASMSLDAGLKKQSTRLVKVACKPCEYIVRMSRKTLEMGLPLCGVCHEEMQETV